MSAARHTSRAFTLIELIVVVVIIAILIGIAAPAFLAVRRGAARTATESQLQSMASAIDQFKTDFGYLPLLILDDPEVERTDPDWCTALASRDDAIDKLEAERYHSIYSLPVYLLGLGALSPDPTSNNPDRHDGHGGAGFRDPGPDRAWGGARERTTDTHRVVASGQIYTPYVDYADTDRVRSASTDLGDFPEDTSLDADEPDAPWRSMSVILDGWGTAIRYYRNWPTRPASGTPGATLLDAPAELVDPDALAEAPENANEFDASRDVDLARAEYALLSAGADRIFVSREFAKQGPSAEGTVEDFLMKEARERRRLLREGMDDNIRVVR